MKYIQFFNLKNEHWETKENKFIKTEPFFDEKIASEGYLPFDGRLNIDSILNSNVLKARQKQFPDDYSHFEIRTGTLTKYNVLYRNFEGIIYHFNENRNENVKCICN